MASVTDRFVGQVLGPVVPTPEARAVQRPLGIDEVRLDGGVWGRWQRLNHDVSIPSNLSRLESEGSLGNLRLAAGEGEGEFRTPVFMDAAVYKTLEAVVWEYFREPDEALKEWIVSTTELLTRAQGDDGYINSYIQAVHPEDRYRHLGQSHEVYCAGILMQAAIAAERTGFDDDGRLMAVARRFADHIVDTFLDKRPEIDGHPGVEINLIELYRLTGEQSYLDLASQYVYGRGVGRVDPGGRRRYYQDHERVTEAPTQVGHAVRAMYLDAAVVDLYLENGDKSLLDASIRRWEDMVANKTYLTGGIGSRHAEEAIGDAWELPPDRSYSESCAAFAGIFWYWRLLLATGEARYAELIERTLFNVFAASTSVDGFHYFYVNPLQRRSDHWESDDNGRRHEWFQCPCCPPNITRLVAALGHYLFTTDARTLFLHQYAAATITTSLGERPLAVRIETDYPWDADVRITIDEAPGPMALALRIPGWAAEPRVSINGEAQPVVADEKGYVRLEREWAAGDVVQLVLPMPPRLSYPDDRIDAVRGAVAIERGPLVYCFEQVDQADGVDVTGLLLRPDAAITVLEEDDPVLGHTVKLRLEAQLAAPPVTTGLPYSTTPSTRGERRAVTAIAVPYFLWDNRDGGPMRVWMPLDTTQSKEQRA